MCPWSVLVLSRSLHGAVVDDVLSPNQCWTEIADFTDPQHVLSP